MRLLELFSGTHSIGKVAHRKGYEVVSVDRDLDGKCPFGSGYESDKHIKIDILTWDYKVYPPGHFDVITASPVCLWWSHLRYGWIGRKCKKIHPTEVITKEHIDADIERYGKPMVDKVFEIIDYFKPKHWWVENPATGRMKQYITDKDYYDVDYCKYSDWGYKKRTRFWTNIKDFKPKLCKSDCDNIVVIDTKKLHRTNLGNQRCKNIVKKHSKDVQPVGGGGNRLERYRIPEKLIEELLSCNKMKLLELFSGTHSIGKVAHGKGYEVVSLDRDLDGKCPFGSGYVSDKHIKTDIMTWDYKQYPVGHFDVITASPVCLWWSGLRRCWIGRKCKSIHPTETITKEHIDGDIEKYGKPMVDKVFEIIDYFKPKHWWVENPATGRMKQYITDKPFYDVDYCKYSDWGYKKRTRLWTNIKGFEPRICKMDCDNIIEIKTQKGDKRGKEEIKGESRKLHNNATCCGRNAKSIKNAIKNNEVVKGNHRIAFGGDHGQGGYTGNGGGSNRLERYRIPEKLIEELLSCK